MSRRSRAQAFPAPVQHNGRIAVRAEEGIVPGLDFCNHNPRSPVRWTVWGACGTAARSHVQPTTPQHDQLWGIVLHYGSMHS